ncbi:rod shape-determining protein MreD [Caldibacillus thermolactis]|jgi:rod shape-determining protein MreD|uniref:Rod shape-determining protein MreD n=1 Tax=Pallidibacillus thermolactis TaxID=251051 RepID=A0ABT2WDL0_9BACI|nr:rod shape-determining protein MreD [Pallidibacillus thermolactis]MCU9592874.1 rod shape-determining protein MreD [Pallidibacillus thermolactis]MED1673773.1 rod shape-determining protein MreD [Pallidibacillus thermolactis subsp. kokeshiiformis]
MRKKYWVPIIMLILFSLESIIMNYVPSYFFNNHWLVIPRFLFIFLLFITIFYDKKLGVTYAFVFGLLMDIVFTEIYGIYLFVYPAVVYIMYWLVKNWITNLFTMFFYSAFGLIALEIVLFLLYYMINLSDISFKYFAFHRLLPTMLMNMIFYVAICFPLKKYLSALKKLKEEEEGMFQS